MSNSNNNSQKDSDENKQPTEAEKSNLTQKPYPTILEWTVRGFSVLLVAAVFGYFIVQIFQPKKETNIAFSILSDKIEQRGMSWKVPVDITNQGSRSIHTLEVKAKLQKPGKSNENSFTTALLGPGQTVRSEFWFDSLPNKDSINFYVISYEVP